MNKLTIYQTLLLASVCAAWAPVIKHQPSRTALNLGNVDVGMPVLIYAGAVAATMLRTDKPTFEAFKETGVEYDPKKIETEGKVPGAFFTQKEVAVEVKQEEPVTEPEPEAKTGFFGRQTEPKEKSVEKSLVDLKKAEKEVETKVEKVEKSLDDIKKEVASTKESIAATEAIAKKNKAAKEAEEKGSLVEEEEPAEAEPAKKSKRVMVKRVLKKVVMPWKKFSEIQ